MDKLKITGKSRARILVALYNNSQPLGLGVFAARGAPPMTEEIAQSLVDNSERNGRVALDYVAGRPIKIGFEREGDDDFLLWPRLYDRDNGGDGTCAFIVGGVS